MIINNKNYDRQISKITTDITSANSLISKNTTDIASANTKITKNASDITTANGRITQNASAISTTNSNLASVQTELTEVSNLAHNNLCYTMVFSIAQSSNYVFGSPFLRGMFIGQVNDYIHVIHISKEGVYSSAQGFKTGNMDLMSIAQSGNSITITNKNADNVLRVFALFK